MTVSPATTAPFKDSYVLLPVCESGGVCLEWFKNQFMKDESYTAINEAIGKKALPNELIFLPYITGANAPDFNNSARGVFLRHPSLNTINMILPMR